MLLMVLSLYLSLCVCVEVVLSGEALKEAPEETREGEQRAERIGKETKGK